MSFSPRVVFDIDQVIVDVVRPLLRYFFPNTLEVEKAYATLDNYDMSIPLGVTPEVIRSGFDKVIAEDDYAFLEKDVTWVILKRISSFVETWLYTSRPVHLQAATRLWFRGHGVDNKIIFASQDPMLLIKDQVIFVTDCPSQLENAANANLDLIPILFMHPWSSVLPNSLRGRAYLVENWDRLGYLIVCLLGIEIDWPNIDITKGRIKVGEMWWNTEKV